MNEESEAKMQEEINQANGLAKAIIIEAEARQKGLNAIAKALNEVKNGKRIKIKLKYFKTRGQDAANLLVAEKSVKAFEKLAKENNTLIMPADLSPVNSLLIQAMSVYKQITGTNQPTKMKE